MLTSRLLRTFVSVLSAAALAGCLDRDPEPPPTNQLTVASRTDVSIMLRTGRPAPVPLAGTYIGDVIAVTGYGFSPVAAENLVTIGGAACPVTGYVELNRRGTHGTFGALYVEVRSHVPTGNTLEVSVRRTGAAPSQAEPGLPATLAVHRLAFATPAAGNVVHAVDCTALPPAWIASRDLAVSGLPNAVAMYPDGRFALFAAGADLQVTAVADGRTILHAAGFFGGTVGTMQLSRDGRLLAATVFPAGRPPEVVVADLAWLERLPFNVIPSTGMLIPGVPAPPSPARMAIGLGGAAAGGVAFDAAGTRLYATLSSGVVRVWDVSPQSTPSFSHELAMPQGTAPFGLTLTPDDRLALITDIAVGLLIPVETADGATQSPLLAGPAPLRPRLTTNGAHLLVPDAASGAVRVFHAGATTVTTSQPALTLGFSPSASAVAAEGLGGTPGRNTILLIDGNRLRFAEAALAGGTLSLSGHTAGPFPNGLRLLAVTPAR